MAIPAKLRNPPGLSVYISRQTRKLCAEQGIVKLRSDKSEMGRISSEGDEARAIETKGGGHPFSPRKILVPVDFSKCSGAAVEHAMALCKAFHARLTLLHVVEPAVHGDNYVTVGSSLDPLNQNLVEAAHEKLDQYARKTAGEEAHVETLVRIGRAYSEIPDTAEALGADLIVVGSCGTAGMNTSLLGSTAERVVRHAPCPVLTVRCAPPPHSLRHT